MEVLAFKLSPRLWIAFCYDGNRFRCYHITGVLNSKETQIKNKALEQFQSETQYSADSNIQHLVSAIFNLTKKLTLVFIFLFVYMGISLAEPPLFCPQQQDTTICALRIERNNALDELAEVTGKLWQKEKDIEDLHYYWSKYLLGLDKYVHSRGRKNE